jgi:hypothetical protein
VLFSDERIAPYINNSFEPVWESVRPVPIVRIDFGNGNVITRTLHGNIASYVCTSEGQLLDILPGIYTPRGYQEALERIRIVASNIRAMPAGQREPALRQYHQQWAEALAKGQTPLTLLEIRRIVPVGKGKIESPLERVLARKPANQSADEPTFDLPDDLASWKALAEDTRLNEKPRRQAIHEMLATRGQVKPDQVSKWLYKEVLHADLDDPYLGLGKVLFASYPFSQEDKR